MQKLTVYEVDCLIRPEESIKVFFLPEERTFKPLINERRMVRDIAEIRIG